MEPIGKEQLSQFTAMSALARCCFKLQQHAFDESDTKANIEQQTQNVSFSAPNIPKYSVNVLA